MKKRITFFILLVVPAMSFAISETLIALLVWCGVEAAICTPQCAAWCGCPKCMPSCCYFPDPTDLDQCDANCMENSMNECCVWCCHPCSFYKMNRAQRERAGLLVGQASEEGYHTQQPRLTDPKEILGAQSVVFSVENTNRGS